MAAAQMLDEKLSRDIDVTLTKANIPRPAPQPSCIPNHRPLSPTFSLPKTPSLVHSPPKPPQLPYLNFGGLDLMSDFPHLTLTARTPPPPAPTPIFPSVPSWCPDLPSFADKNMKWSDFPLFFDLSKLPEPKKTAPQPSECRELQLWRSPRPQKHSRYFPPPTSPKPRETKTPSTAYKLHQTDAGITNTASVKASDFAKLVVRSAEDVKTQACKEDASAANLWRILTTSNDHTTESPSDPYLDSFVFSPAEDIFYDHRTEIVGMPAELDNTEIPYVHANSLTGYANDRAEDPITSSDEEIAVLKASGLMTSVSEASFGLNEMGVHPYDEDDYYANAILEAIELPPLPESPATQDDSQANCHDLKDSFFDRSPIAEPSNESVAEEDLIDVATFLRTETRHPIFCWCKDCEEPPELIDVDSLDEDDGWMVYSCSDYLSSSKQPDWDDSLPSTLAHGSW